MESDLMIYARSHLDHQAREALLRHRGQLEAHIRQYPAFEQTLNPWRHDLPAPAIIRKMVDAGRKTGVGPMAAVAGAMAEAVGRDLMAASPEVMVENGGDLFVCMHRPVTAALFAGRSPLSMKVGLKLAGSERPRAVCTSSGSVGHSLSFGKADAICILAESCALADAAATAIGNHIQSEKNISAALEECKNIEGLEGAVIVVGSKMGAWGDVELVPIDGKKG